MAPKSQAADAVTTITAPDIRTVAVQIEGTAPYVQNKFSQKMREALLAKHMDPTSRSKRTREAKDPKALYEGAMHKLDDGSVGIPASAFRAAMIDACRLVGYKMTQAKMSVFVKPDGFDADDGTPLVRFTGGDPEMTQLTTRNETGVADVRVRPMWRRWAAVVRLQYDAAQFGESDVINLLLRAGMQVGVGEGRPFSKKSAGMGWGTFTISNMEGGK